MFPNNGSTMGRGMLALVTAGGIAWPMQAQHPTAQEPEALYPRMAPIAQYRMDRTAEIALARTAAPASISGHASVWVLGRANFELAVRGTNGFICVVGRAFAGPLNNPEFWSPKNRSPICLNPPAARSLWPYALRQAAMALAGASKVQITAAIRAAVARGELGPPAQGAMAYMMSREAYLTDRGTHNLAHLMFELPSTAEFQDDSASFVSWDPAPVIEFNVPVGRWSDGSDASGKN